MTLKSMRVEREVFATVKTVWPRIKGLFFADKDVIDSRIKSDFEAAKKISDFVGMATRLVFLGVAIRFFFQEYFDNSGRLEGFRALTATLITTCFTIYFGVRVCLIVLNYSVRDVGVTGNVISRLISLVIGLWAYYAIVGEATKGIYALAHATRLAP